MLEIIGPQPHGFRGEGMDRLYIQEKQTGSMCMILVSLLPSSDMQLDVQVCHTICQNICKMKWQLLPTPVNLTNVMLPQMLIAFYIA